MNDLINLTLTNGLVFSYADDTSLLFQDDNWSEVFIKAEAGLHKVITWLRLNLLTLNTNKTNFIPFSINESLQPDINLTLTAHTCTSYPSDKCSCLNINIKE